MAILEMIPKEYWRQLYIELYKVDWDKENPPKETKEQRHKRIAKQYDEAIALKKQKDKREYNIEYREQWRRHEPNKT